MIHFVRKVALPDLIATPGGSFTAWPAGLGVDAFSGLLDLSTATPGTYTVTYTTPVSLCTSSMDLTIAIDTVTDAFLHMITRLLQGRKYHSICPASRRWFHG